jgi:hypothetical protein
MTGSPNRTTSVSGRRPAAGRGPCRRRSPAARQGQQGPGTRHRAALLPPPTPAGRLRGTGYFELDGEDFATVAAGLEAAMPAPSAGPNDVTTDAVGHADDEDADESQTADGDPAFCDPYPTVSVPGSVPTPSCCSPRAFLPAPARMAPRGGHGPAPGRLRTVRPGRRRHLTYGTAVDRHPRRQPAVTQEALRRLASDADLQFMIKDHGQTVGVSAPTSTIPARVRAAVAARDQGCRFPGCRMPIQFTDCHHVKAREDDGPTIISNLVALCRRHHTAVTEGRWKLTMTPDGTVTVRRGRRHATSDPPAVTLFRGPPNPRTARPAESATARFRSARRRARRTHHPARTRPTERHSPHPQPPTTHGRPSRRHPCPTAGRRARPPDWALRTSWVQL